MIRLPPNRHLSGETHQTWVLPNPVGEVELSVAGESLEDASELTFRAGGYSSSDEATAAGETFRGWLRLTSALEGGGFDCGTDALVSGLGANYRAQIDVNLSKEGAFLIEDVHGLVVYQEKGQPRRLTARGTATVRRPSDAVRDTVIRAAHSDSLTEKQALACDLVSMMDHESSNRARLLTLVSAMEVLAERPERAGPVRSLLERFIQETEKAQKATSKEQEKREFASLLGGLKDLRQMSISASVRELAERARPDEPGTRRLVSQSYRCRSELVHEGKSDQDPRQLLPDLTDLVRHIIRSWLTK